MGKGMLAAIGATQIVLIVFIVLLIIAYPIMVYSRNKKDSQKMQEQTNSLKRGDKILTTSGIYGTVVDLHMEEDKKIVTIETGMGKNKGYMAIDAYAIYTVFSDEPKQESAQKVEEKVAETKPEEKKEEPVENDKVQEKTEEPKVEATTEQPSKPKRSRKKKEEN